MKKIAVEDAAYYVAASATTSHAFAMHVWENIDAEWYDDEEGYLVMIMWRLLKDLGCLDD